MKRHFPDSIAAGTVLLDQYRIVKVLGQGGFGLTYLATDIRLEMPVAVKEYFAGEISKRDGKLTVYAHESNKEQFEWGLNRFLDEARSLGRFRHANIVQVLNFFEANGTAYMVMGYEKGESLEAVLRREKTLPEERLLEIVLPLLSGLGVLHAAGYIHRDIKPGNIYIRDIDGSPVLLDFGSARQAIGEQTKTLTAMLTPGYAPFEQYQSNSKRQGPWTDIYSLGAVMYRAVGGHMPAIATDRSSAILLQEPDPMPSAKDLGRGRYSEVLLEAIDLAMQVLEKHRPQTVEQLRVIIANEQTIDDFVNEQKTQRMQLAEDALENDVAAPRTIVRRGKRERKGEDDGQQTGFGLKLAMIVILVLVITVVAGSAWMLRSGVHQSPSNTVVAPPNDGQIDASLEKESETPAVVKKRENQREQAALDLRKQKIADLLALAQANLATNDLVTPKGASAWDQFAAAANLDPDNERAMTGMAEVKKRLFKNVEVAIRERAFSKALLGLEKADDIGADKADIGRLRAMVITTMGKVEANKLEARRKAELERKQKFEESQRELAKRNNIRGLLAEAEKDIRANRLTTPKGKNAFARYQQVLALEAENEVAKQGIGLLAKRYIKYAEEALGEGNFDRAQRFIDILKVVDAGNETGRKMQVDLDAARQRAADAKEKEAEAKRQAAAARREEVEVAARRKEAAAARRNQAVVTRQNDSRNVLQQPDDGSTKQLQEMEKFLNIARQARQENRLEKAQRFIDLAESVGLDDAAVKAEQRHLDKAKYASEQNNMRATKRRDSVASRVVSKPEPAAGTNWQDPFTNMKFKWVPKGCFQMGGQTGDDDEKPEHRVCLSKGFFLGIYEVTQEQWKKVLGTNPSFFPKGDDWPVENVAWDDVQKFFKRLNISSSYMFRLPSEAEWEYACRSGGKNETYCGGNDPKLLANYAGGASAAGYFMFGGETSPVGQDQANGIGMYDMSGNVSEWVQDWFGSYSKSTVTDPKGPSTGRFRVFRGGGWFVKDAKNLRAGNRSYKTSDFKGNGVGFRVVRILQ